MPNFAYDIDNSATISSTSLNIILTDNFTHTRYSFSGFNNFSNLAISTDGTFTNNNTINLDGNLTITANSFTNTGGVLNSDTFALSVAGDFDYTKKGTITTNAFSMSDFQCSGAKLKLTIVQSFSKQNHCCVMLLKSPPTFRLRALVVIVPLV